MMVNKKDVIKLLETIAVHMELKGENPFKISAFRKAANALEQDERSLTNIEDFTKIQGIGKGTATVINEFIETGKSSVLEELKQDVPQGLISLLKLPGLGGKKIAKLYHQLQVIDIETLKKACEEKKVQELAGFGKKTEEKILAEIEELGSRPERLPLAFMLPVADDIENILQSFHSIEQFSRAGSIRRLKETIKDLDFIISTNHPQKVREQLLSIPHIVDVIANGDTKVSIELEYDYHVSVDFRLVKKEEFATTLHHFTGSKDHNVKMRQLAKERGEKISEYGVEKVETEEIQHFETEEAFFNHFDLPFITPELRIDGSEVDKVDELSLLIDQKDVKGDLHMHSTWSDGAYTIEEMAEACRKKGYQYMAITDHSQFLKVANGLTPQRLREQKKEIDALNKKYHDFYIFSGIEMDILPDGTLDFDDDVLKELDFVIASIHSNFSQDREKIMERLKVALKNHHVNMIAHPTGRLIGKRKGYEIDVDGLIELAKETNTALELNANPNRLDLRMEHLVKAQKKGVRLVINTDAHNIDMLGHMNIGVAAARRARILSGNVLNTMDVNQLKDFLYK
ncbi:DNA polymerase/3'-5' exonuclease PolX [Bacillus carboniphilus]|uniref:DNA polymerase beta n=1 Tax=Bacillus carboniphilus TaxID=86663 RepID=A0ABY9JXL9_9BACI|nr:DNA polymerase/3'-5' exonuclease PolX [Bacillus carboniphilus]WLR44137.1 DNA polymerase/3'-5' exonuclease PolX [Bacillus carboniphilus]